MLQTYLKTLQDHEEFLKTFDPILQDLLNRVEGGQTSFGPFEVSFNLSFAKNKKLPRYVIHFSLKPGPSLRRSIKFQWEKGAETDSYLRLMPESYGDFLYFLRAISHYERAVSQVKNRESENHINSEQDIYI